MISPGNGRSSYPASLPVLAASLPPLPGNNMNIPTNPSDSFKALNPHLYGSVSPEVAITDQAIPEREIQDQIEEFLRSLGPECYYVRSRMDKPTTNAVGTPDFIGWYRGTPFAFEVKRKGRKPTPEQQAKLAWCHRAGAVNVCVVHSVDRVREMLTATQNAPPDFVQVLENLGNDPMARIDARQWAKHYRRKLKK